MGFIFGPLLIMCAEMHNFAHARGIPLACKTRTNTTKMYGKMVSPFFLEITLKTMYFTLKTMYFTLKTM